MTTVLFSSAGHVKVFLYALAVNVLVQGSLTEYLLVHMEVFHRTENSQVPCEKPSALIMTGCGTHLSS